MTLSRRAVLGSLLLGLAPASAAAQDDLAAELRRLQARRVYFGHQSVGENLLDGLRDLARAASVPLSITPTSSAPAGTPSIVEGRVGENGKPLSKIAAFEEALAAPWAQGVDVALFKLCYVDFDAQTDVRALFDRYVEAHARLRERYPDVTLVHVTVPLTTTQEGIKARIKRLVGRRPAGEAENDARHAFNELLRARFGGKEPLFDLARAESVDEQGRVSTSEHEGRATPRLVPAFTDDGEHLNERGRRHVARELVRVLAGAP